MKIVNLCLCGIYTDDWTYQDNLLTAAYAKLGNDVTIITSKWMFTDTAEPIKDTRKTYKNSYGVKIKRLAIVDDKPFSYKFKRYHNLYQSLKKEQPDILFIHGCQFVDIPIVKKYIQNNKVQKVYLDNHADFSNSATNWLSYHVLHKMIWKHYGKVIEKYVDCFYGVLPARVDFLVNVYKINPNKVKLLPMGADDDKVIEARSSDIKKKMRKKYGIDKEDFLIITGGKIDKAKTQVLQLMLACKSIKNEHIKLIIFGSVEKELQGKFMQIVDDKKIQYIGWVQGSESYTYFSMADLVVFPGRHSVYWEQAVGLGIPCIFKYWEGTTYVDVGGNCKFLYKNNVRELKKIIKTLYDDKDLYQKMLKAAEEKGMEIFSYIEIAKNSLKN